MIECIFTIDYEIYGNGQGRLGELVYEPARQLQAVFNRAGVKFVNFVEVAEFDQIERQATDRGIGDVRRQIRELYQQGHEIALHLHPQWSNARFENGRWRLDYSEYNLCVLPRERIARIVDDALAWLRDVVGDPAFTPVAFRAGNWLFQPARDAAAVLADRGLKMDSSVFKGGLQHQHRLDYRPALKNGWHWKFAGDANTPDANGRMIELPIHTEMVPFWRMITGKRVGLHRKGTAAASPCRNGRGRGRLRDFLRLRYPLKFDFCRMTLDELTSMVERVQSVDAQSPAIFKPLVAIGHTKDLADLGTVEAFLAWLKQRALPVSTFAGVYGRCLNRI